MILLTGATGFIGQHVLTELLERFPGNPVCVLVNRRDVWPLSQQHIRIVTGGLEQLNAQSFRTPLTCIIHLASKNIDKDGTGFRQTNVEGTRQIIELAEKNPGVKIIYLSSTGVYGHHAFNNADESTPKDPDTALSKSKFEAEELLRRTGLPVCILRHRFVTGEGDRYVVPGFMKAIRRLPFLPDGGKAFTSIIDVRDLSYLIGYLSRTEWKGCVEYIATNGEELSIACIFEIISRTFTLTGRKKISLPWKPVYSLVRLREKLLQIDPEQAKGRGLNSLQVGFLGRNNRFSNQRVKDLIPGYVFRTFEESVRGAKDYYSQFLLP